MLDKFARPQDRAHENREQALLRAYMSTNFGDPSTFAGGGAFEKKATATGKALARLAWQVSGGQGLFQTVDALAHGRPSGGNGMIIGGGDSGTFGRNPRTALVTKAFTQFMDEYALPVRAEAGRTGRAQSTTGVHHQPVPPIATSKEGVPLDAFSSAPEVTSYLGDDTLSLMLERIGVAKQPNANRLTSGMLDHGVDPMDLPLRRDLKEAMTGDLYSYGVDEVEEGLGAIQGMIDQGWMRQRGEATARYNSHMAKASELERRGNEFKDSPVMGLLARRMLETAAKRRQHARQEFPYLIPEGLQHLLRGTRGGDTPY